MLVIKTIDAHAAGEPLRLIVDGAPSPRGRTMLAKRGWLRRHADHLRRVLMLEPRGHADMSGALLTEPVSPGSDAGVLFMHNDGYSTMCGHGVIAVTTIALERGLVRPDGDGATLVFDTPAGTIRTRATLRSAADPECRDVRVERVAFLNVPSFVLHPGLTVRIGSRQVRADVAFGGAFHAIVDAESAGVPLDRLHVPELRRMGMEVRQAIEALHAVAHPLDSRLCGIHGTVFTGPPHGGDAHLRNVTVFADAEVDRSPCGTGTAAVMAVLDAMGLLARDQSFVQESIIGTHISGRVAARTRVEGFDAIVPEIDGSAWITGEHAFLVADDDPFKDGFRL